MIPKTTVKEEIQKIEELKELFDFVLDVIERTDVSMKMRNIYENQIYYEFIDEVKHVWITIRFYLCKERYGTYVQRYNSFRDEAVPSVIWNTEIPRLHTMSREDIEDLKSILEIK